MIWWAANMLTQKCGYTPKSKKKKKKKKKKTGDRKFLFCNFLFEG